MHKWSVEQVKAFHQRWYFPANATLYVVGDIGSVAATVKEIEVSEEAGGKQQGSAVGGAGRNKWGSRHGIAVYQPLGSAGEVRCASVKHI